jgi:hypothetical protein
MKDGTLAGVPFFACTAASVNFSHISVRIDRFTPIAATPTLNPVEPAAARKSCCFIPA